MSLSIGIVGLPNAGKSTLFNALLQKQQAQVAEHPFTTINPNIGIVDVPDKRLEQIAKITKVKKTIPSTLKIYDIAGLVRGAHRGQGLGNQFLSEINRVDLIAIVIRFFEHSNIPHPEDNLHPGNDLQTILTELCLKDLGTIKKAQEKIAKQLKAGENRQARQIFNILEKISVPLNVGQPPKISRKEKEIIKNIPLLTLKPMIFVANCSEEQLKEADELTQNFCPQVDKDSWIYLDALTENQIMDLKTEEKEEMRQILGWGADGLKELIVQSFTKLNLITFFTYNQDETRAWQIPQGTSARQAAAKIHQDFYQLFIKARVIDFDSFQKKQNKTRTEGEHYQIKDGDIVKFVLNRKSISRK